MILGNHFNTMFYLLPVILILSMSAFFAWIYTMGTELNKKLPDTVSVNLNKFRGLLLYSIGYVAFFCLFALVGFKMLSDSESTNNNWPLFILPFHIAAFYGIIYSLYFIAKELKSVELRQEVKFGDFAGEFMLLWFYPLGIWVIQPRINRIFDETGADNGGSALDSNLKF